MAIKLTCSLFSFKLQGLYAAYIFMSLSTIPAKRSTENSQHVIIIFNNPLCYAGYDKGGQNMAKCRITNERGAPTLKINGMTVAPVMYGLSDIPGSDANTAQAQRNIKNFREAGINLVCCDTGIHLGWHKVTQFDTEAIREEIGAVLEANPDAGVLLRLHMNPPYWWLRDHPEECIIYRKPDGDVPGIDDGNSDRLIRDDFSSHLRVSLASELWLREANEKLIALLKELDGTREGDALVGIQPACGVYGEWHQWGVDVSVPMKARFTRYLREKYGTVDALRRAWHNPTVTFEDAELRPEPWRPGDDGSLRDPRISQDTTDSQECNQLTVAEAIIRFCRTVKEYMPDVLAGSFYGYYFGLNGNTATVKGHLRPDLAYADPAVEFLCGPFSYGENRNTWGVPQQRALLESNRLRGMLWLTEMDQEPAGTNMLVGGDLARLDETVCMLRRNALQPLLAGQGFWYYDHRIIPRLLPNDSENKSAGSIYRKHGWWERPEYLEEISRIQRLAEDISQRDYESVADVLLVYDTESFFHRSRARDDYYRMHESLMRNGVVFDSIYSGELELADMDRYKCVIFANCIMITPEKRGKYARLTEGRLRIFVNGSGFCDGESISVRNVSETVGMRMKRTESREMIYGDKTIAHSEDFAPALAVEEADVEVLTRWDSGEVACAVKGSCAYYPYPSIPKGLMRTLLERAGVHFWCDSDEPVIAGAGYVAVNCQRAGERTLSLPCGKQIKIKTDGLATPVYDIKSGKLVM